MEPIDSLALIGRTPLDRDHVYVATGDSGNGLTHGTIAGMLITDLIMGRSNPWVGLDDPARLRHEGDPRTTDAMSFTVMVMMVAGNPRRAR